MRLFFTRGLQMNDKFYALLERIFKQYVKALLDDRAKLKSVLCDYAEGEFLPEIRLFLQAIEAGCHTRITQADGFSGTGLTPSFVSFE
jgi:hypothetical protein